MLRSLITRASACFVLLFAAASALADTDALLSRLPAQNAAEAAEINAALIAGGEAGLAALTQQLKPAGDNTDQPARYALGGLSFHVTRPGAPAEERAAFNAAVTAALPGAVDDEARAFLMQLLHVTGDDACVPAIAAYLGHARLAPDARLALEAIGGPAATQALTGGPAAPEEYPHNTMVMTPPPPDDAFRDRLRAAEGDAAWAVLVEGLESEYTSIRQLALHEAGKGFPGKVYTRRLARMARKAPIQLQPEFLLMLGKRGDETAIDAVSDHIGSDDEAVRKAALTALMMTNTPEADALVRGWLDSAKPGEAATAAEALIASLPGKERILPQPDEEGFVPLFNGVDLTGWVGYARGYGVEDGAIVCKDASLNLFTRRDYGNFILRFDVKLTPAANNGVGIRTPMRGTASEEGMEIQVLDDGHEQYKDIKDYQSHGSVYGIAPAARGHLKPVGEWNQQEIHVEGNRVKVTLNGVVIVDADVKAIVESGAPDGKDHSGALRPRGHIGLLGHGDTVYYRNLRVKEL
ncbi:MAG: hypothetical protein RLZZ303_1085 [Candidatus Hydrogenedentota bacterium]